MITDWLEGLTPGQFTALILAIAVGMIGGTIYMIAAGDTNAFKKECIASGATFTEERGPFGTTEACAWTAK